jgi:hypothetical protein
MTPDQAREFLELIPTTKLYDEFKRRFEHVVIAGLIKRPVPEDPEHYVLSFSYVGVPLICQGLALQLIHRCQNDIDASASEMDIREL